MAVSHSRPDGQGGWIDDGTDWYPRQRLRRSSRSRGRAAPQGQQGLCRGPVQDRASSRARTARSGRRSTSPPTTSSASSAAVATTTADPSPVRPPRWVRHPAAVVAAADVRPPTTPTSTTFPSDQETTEPCLPPFEPRSATTSTVIVAVARSARSAPTRRSQIDYKEVNRLRRYLSERAKIEPRRKTGTCAGHQRELAVALKRARHVALLPYAPQHLRP